MEESIFLFLEVAGLSRFQLDVLGN